MFDVTISTAYFKILALFNPILRNSAKLRINMFGE